MPPPTTTKFVPKIVMLLAVAKLTAVCETTKDPNQDETPDVTLKTAINAVPEVF